MTWPSQTVSTKGPCAYLVVKSLEYIEVFALYVELVSCASWCVQQGQLDNMETPLHWPGALTSLIKCADAFVMLFIAGIGKFPEGCQHCRGIKKIQLRRPANLDGQSVSVSGGHAPQEQLI